jgi:hypothetical protein
MLWTQFRKGNISNFFLHVSNLCSPDENGAICSPLGLVSNFTLRVQPLLCVVYSRYIVLYCSYFNPLYLNSSFPIYPCLDRERNVPANTRRSASRVWDGQTRTVTCIGGTELKGMHGCNELCPYQKSKRAGRNGEHNCTFFEGIKTRTTRGKKIRNGTKNWNRNEREEISRSGKLNMRIARTRRL